MKPESSNYILSSLSDALDVLDLLNENGGLSLTEICTALGVSKAKAFRLLYTLTDKGYIVKTADMKYRLSYKFVRFGSNVLRRTDLLTVCRPHMQTLRDAVNEMVHLTVLDENGNGVFLHKEHSTRMFQTMSRVGFSRSAYQLGTGKVLLAYLPEEEQKAFAESYTYEKLTPNTISSADELLRELRTIKEQGYALDNEESEPGLECIAAPVFDGSGTCVAAISISGSVSSVKPNIESLLPQLLACTAACSRELGAF